MCNAYPFIKPNLGDLSKMSKITQWIIAALLMMVSVAGYSFNTSYYGPGFNGKLTASGVRYNQHGISVAHKTLPFGTIIRVTNVKNNKSVIATVLDRGPYIRGRHLDLSVGANKALQCNLCNTKFEILKIGDGKYRREKPTRTLDYMDNIIKPIPVKYKKQKPVAGLSKLNRT